ncbi:MAG TPA: metalloregulator ArsR/SmtB family transcription factor [Terriglobales bacterium]|nr:metalloregulator ArsR/SmtB family transcription factor [Terriglobales bacterium]
MTKQQMHRISKALADPRRYELLSRVAKTGELACSDLRCEIPISAATLSHHLKELANAGLLTYAAKGNSPI